MAKKRKLTMKQKAFVKDVIETQNPTEAVRRNYDVDNDNVATTIASENMRKPDIVTAIDRALVKANLTEDVVTQIHHRNLTQSDNLKVSQTAVKDYYTIKGYGNKTQDTNTVNVAFIINTNDAKKG